VKMKEDNWSWEEISVALPSRSLEAIQVATPRNLVVGALERENMIGHRSLRAEIVSLTTINKNIVRFRTPSVSSGSDLD
jgi:hypothetical protein